MTETSGYAAALVELDCQGRSSRKRARGAKFIPVWGDASWDVKLDDARDGKKDLAEATAFVSTAKQAAAAAEEALGSIMSTTATFTEDDLRWVPRKRHNSRWPIEPRADAGTLGADSRPHDASAANLVSAEAEDVAHAADAKQMRRRSTRRLSRRVSFAPVDDLIESPVASRSPMRGSLVARSPRRLSMIKVSGSPRKVFTMLATPSRVVLAAPLGPSSPMRSPIKQLRLSPVNETQAGSSMAPEDDLPPFESDTLPLLFDQPVPDMQVEPEHETRRRVSLQNGRRSDRRSSGIRALPAFEVAQTAPNRRHSFLHTDSRQAAAKGRRHTLGVFCVDSGEILMEVTSPATEVEPEPMVPQEPFASQAAVVVDVGTNLDIFGQGPEQPSPQRDGSPVDKTLAEHDSHMEVENDGCPFIDTGSVTRHAASSPISNALGLMDYMSADADVVTTNGQAATSPPNTDDGIQQPDSDNPQFAIEPLSTEMADSYSEFQENNMFLPQDPEGLSTIFEESFATDVVKLPEEGIAAAVDYEQATPCRQDTSHKSPLSAARESQLEQTVSPPCTPDEDEVYGDDSSESNDIEEPATPTPAVLLAGAAGSNYEVYAVDDHEQPAAPGANVSLNVPLGSSAGPQAATNVERDQLPTSRPLNRATEILTDLPPPESLSDTPWQSFGSPASSGHSVATPDDDFCGRIALHLESDVTQTALDLELTTPIPAAPADEGVTAFGVDDSEASPHLDHSSSPSGMPESDVLAGTPPKDVINFGVGVADEDADAIPETPPASTTGFTPINDRRISPPETGFGDLDGIIMETDELDDIQNDGIVTAMDYQPTVPIEDITSNLADAISLQEDSETEMLRKFVTRVKADKSAKAAAAAALAKRNLRQKRRSGSTGSVTSTTGSPVSRCESPAKRLPLGEKDLNSPSPVKKRKAPIGSDGFFKGKTTLFSEESSPAPKTKRRRKRLAAELETTLEQSMSLVDPDPAAETGLRRSTRSRSTRVQLRPPAPSANSIALSMIPVRLPGSSGGMMADMDRDMPAIVIPNTRNEEKDLAAVTRLNTRKNKGNSVPPKMVLATQTEDPAAWRMKELKSVFEAREGREAAAGSGPGDSDSKSGRKCRAVKGVRWAEELARFQVQGAEVAAPPASKSAAAASTVASEVTSVVVVEEAEEPPAPPPAKPAAAAAPEVQQPEQQQPPAAKKPPPKRTRASRLQMPTPIRNKTATPASQPEKPAVQLPAKRSAAAAAAAASSSASSSVARMATRRTKIASLGMSANGTPAPKRRTRTAT